MLEKINSWCKKHYQSIFILLGIILIISPIILSNYLNNLDEIWNYNFARNIADGLIPYKNFNMIQTPLLPFIAGLFLKLFGNELIVMRILAIILISCIFFMIYKILKKLKVNIFYILVTLLLLFILLKNYICIDYNFAVLLFTLILIYLEIRNYNANPNYLYNKNLQINNNCIKDKYFYYFINGFICGCCILFKQSTGFLISIISIAFPILFVKNKINLKSYLKTSLIKIIGIFIPISLFIIYLIINGTFSEFINYAILGIKTFTNSIPYTNLLNSNNFIIKIMSIIFPILIIITGVYLITKKERELYGFYSYSLASLIVIYPIADHIHFLIGITPFFILFAYLLFQFFINIISNIENDKIVTKKISNRTINNKLKNKMGSKLQYNLIINLIIKFSQEFLKCIIVLSCIYYCFISFHSLNNYFNNEDKNHFIMHYKNIPISKQLLNKINNIDNYILSQNTNVYILDAEAAIYMISLNTYNKDFDLFLKGNLGAKGENGQIEKIKNLKIGTKILIRNDKSKMNWQTPKKVTTFVENNFPKIGTVNIFDIYEIID